MIFRRARILSMGSVLGPIVLASEEIEDRLRYMAQKLGLEETWLSKLTGVRERRLWEPGFPVSAGATEAAQRALTASQLLPSDIGCVVFTSVCRQYFEPASAAIVAKGLNLPETSVFYDISNACLGFLNGMMNLAMNIELGVIKAGIVTACESSREIIALTCQKLASNAEFDLFARSIATLTGGSGAAAFVLADADFIRERSLAPQAQFLTSTSLSASEHADLCRWGVATSPDGSVMEFMETDTAGILRHGITLGLKTWRRFLSSFAWRDGMPAKVITHQVGKAHLDEMRQRFELRADQDFPSYEYLGNMGTVSIPAGLGLAQRASWLKCGDEFGLLGIGSGLSSSMLGLRWLNGEPEDF